MIKFLPLILRNLLRNPRRTVLTALAVAIAVFIFSSLNTITTTMQKFFKVETTEHIRLLTRERYGSPGMIYLPESYGQKIAAIPGVTDVLPFNFFGGRAGSDPGVFVRGMGADPTIASRIFGDQWHDIPSESIEEYKNNRTAMMVGETTMKKFGWQVGQQVHIKLVFPRPGELDVKIVGVGRHPRFANWASIHRDYLVHATRTQGQCMGFWTTAKSEADATRIASAIDHLFTNGPVATKTETEKSFFQNLTGWLSGFLSMVTGLSIVVLIVTAIICLNSISMSVRERMTEFGILRALGFGVSHLLFFVLGESLLSSALGGILGISAAAIILSTFGFRGLFFIERVELQPETLFYAFLAALALGLVSGLFPAIRAARARAIEILRPVE